MQHFQTDFCAPYETVLEEHHFQDEAQLRKIVGEVLASRKKAFFRNAIDQLSKRWRRGRRCLFLLEKNC